MILDGLYNMINIVFHYARHMSNIVYILAYAQKSD
jgi:hypothetical protein